jgi:hypothetical protein
MICIAISLSAQTINDLRTAANRGDAEAQCVLGMFYYAGHEVSQNYVEAANWFRKSAEKDFAAAQVLLGAFYYSGTGVEQNNATALYWCEKAYKNWGTMSKETRDMLAQQGLDKAFLENIINELKAPTPKTAPYLSTSTSSVNFSASGGTREITVNTNDNDWACSKVSDWCDLAQNGNTIRLVCDANNGNTRSDYFLVYYGERGADGKRTQNVRVNVTQDAGVKTPSAQFENIWVVHNVFENPYNIYSRKGMQIHIKFSVDGMLNKRGDCVVWFYFSDGSALKDNNGSYRATDGQVSTSSKFTSNYENCIFNDFVIFMPYDELHLSRGSHNCMFKIGLFDNNDKQIATSEYQSFTFSRTF